MIDFEPGEEEAGADAAPVLVAQVPGDDVFARSSRSERRIGRRVSSRRRWRR